MARHAECNEVPFLRWAGASAAALALALVGSPASALDLYDAVDKGGRIDDRLRVVTGSSEASRVVRGVDGRVQVYVRVTDSSPAALTLLEREGLAVQRFDAAAGIVQGWISTVALDSVAALDFVRSIEPPDYAKTRVGAVTTAGDQILRADELRALGADGAGVRVGVISDGVDSIASSRASGDVPNSVSIVTFRGSGDEGTAMLEIIHDLAPAAELGFCGPETSLEMAACIADLRSTFGADIIVDDLGFLGEPYFPGWARRHRGARGGGSGSALHLGCRQQRCGAPRSELRSQLDLGDPRWRADIARAQLRSRGRRWKRSDARHLGRSTHHADRVPPME